MSEGLHCPKFFITLRDDIVKFHVHVYKDEPENIWADIFKEKHPDLSDKFLRRWVKMGDTELVILGVDSSMPGDDYIRAKDRHGNEWLIHADDLVEKES